MEEEDIGMIFFQKMVKINNKRGAKLYIKYAKFFQEAMGGLSGKKYFTKNNKKVLVFKPF